VIASDYSFGLNNVEQKASPVLITPPANDSKIWTFIVFTFFHCIIFGIATSFISNISHQPQYAIMKNTRIREVNKGNTNVPRELRKEVRFTFTECAYRRYFINYRLDQFYYKDNGNYL
jgi:hypothetical protein